MREVLDWLHASPVAGAVRESAWGYPLLETVHILGLALVVGSILAYDLRLLGLNADLPVSALGRHLLPWVWTGFAANVLSGALLFVSDAAEFAANTAFRWKLGLIVLAGLNALWFQWRIAPGMAAWDQRTKAPPAARRAAALSIVLWLAVVSAGRLMAYVK